VVSQAGEPGTVEAITEALPTHGYLTPFPSYITLLHGNTWQWQEVLTSNQVIVATAQVLLNLLEKGSNYISFDRINHLVLDECHAAVKKHAYNKIMTKYSEAKLDQRPKILAMTVGRTIVLIAKASYFVHACLS